MYKRGFLIDMDGVMYRGGDLIDGADEFIRTAYAANSVFVSDQQ